MRVLLVCMPFVSVERPAVGVSTLKALLAQRGLECDVLYLSVRLAHRLSRPLYDRIAEGIPFAALAGEWVFTQSLYGAASDPGEGYVAEVLRRRWGLDGDDVDACLEVRSTAESFLREALETTPWAEYDLVGFSSSVAQNLASLALAKRLREAFPSVVIAFGGANWQAEMGRELHLRFPFVDLAFSGDADSSFPAAVEALGARRGLQRVAGLVHRSNGLSVSTGSAGPYRDLDALPVPDHSDFFAALGEWPRARGALPSVPLESSRGCWWGERRPCGFCGLDGDERVFRSKSPSRVVWELRELDARYRGGRLFLVDNVVAPSFLDEVLPMLAVDPPRLPLFFNTRPTLTRDQLSLMGELDVHFQPGIESFSDRVLRLLHKGTDALENVRLLKWCRQYGAIPHWNIVYGVPGETAEDYEAMLDLLPSLTSFVPPRCCGPVSLDRYSPFWEGADRHGFCDLESLAPYRYLYPFPEAALARIAYAFQYVCDPPALPSGIRDELRRRVGDWQRQFTQDALQVHRGDSGELSIVDDRPGARERLIRLDPLEQLVYRSCDDIASVGDVRELAWRALAAEAGEVDRCIEGLVGRRLMARVGERCLSLAVDPPATRGR